MASHQDTPYSVLIVDDSAVVRGLMTRFLTSDPMIEVVASAASGAMALSIVDKYNPDVIILDIEMPVMDGMTALPLLLKKSPRSKVIIASSLSRRNAEISLKALELGASDYLPKPSSTEGKDALQVFHRELLEKVKVLATTSRHNAPLQERSPTPDSSKKVITPAIKATGIITPSGVRYPSSTPRVLAIGSSTGGPQALFSLFSGLKGKLKNVPVFLTQHMPPTFTAILAEHLQNASGRPCAEAKDGEVVQPGHVYVAPGDYHLIVQEHASGAIVRLSKDPPENFCRPAVDPMLRSLSAVYGKQMLVAILTGMGQDGMLGAKNVTAAGGAVIAQDEATSVVWGMPRAVAEQKLAHAVLPLQDIAPYILKAFGES